VKLGISVVLLALLAGACREKPRPKPQGVELTAFEKDVLLDLDALKSNPDAAVFLKDLESRGLLKGLKTSPTQEDLRRFQKVLAEHSKGSSFIKPKPPAKKPAEPSCEPSSKPEVKPSLLSPGADESCPADQKASPRVSL
jgi:hypothetical protein